jgi:hypothetical protein
MPKRKRPTKPRSAPLPGVSLERAVARIQQMMDPDTKVTHNERLEDRAGNKRQFDVVIRGTFGGRQVLGVIECKDHKRQKGPDAIEAFAKKAENVGANVRLMVSSRGFTEQALRLAAFEHVECLSLLPNDPMAAGISFGHFWYGRVRRWTDWQLTIYFPIHSAPVPSVSSNAVLWRGLPVLRWFLRELFTVYSQDKDPGIYSLQLPFEQMVQINGAEYPVTAIACRATWVQRNKRKWVSLSGDGYYDWHSEAIRVPANTSLVGGSVETDILLWGDYDGDMPPMDGDRPAGPPIVIMSDVQRLPDDELEVPELAPSGSLQLSRCLNPEVPGLPPGG